MSVVMGIDASTTCTGISIFNNKNLVYSTEIRAKSDEWHQRLIEQKDQIEEIIKKAFRNAIVHEKVFDKLSIYEELFVFKNILPQNYNNAKDILRIKAKFLRECDDKVFSLQAIADILQSSKTTIQKLVKEVDNI